LFFLRITNLFPYSVEFEDLYPTHPLLSTHVNRQISALLYSLVLAVNSNYYDHSGSVFNENLMSVGMGSFFAFVKDFLFLFFFFIS
jgi:hypothetical protein